MKVRLTLEADDADEEGVDDVDRIRRVLNSELYQNALCGVFEEIRMLFDFIESNDVVSQSEDLCQSLDVYRERIYGEVSDLDLDL